MDTQRIRVKDERKPGVWTWETKQCDKPGGCSTTAAWRTVSGPTQYQKQWGRYSSMRDFVVSDFHARKRRGEIFFNPMSRRVQYIAEGSGSVAPILVDKQLQCIGTGFEYYPKYQHPINGISMGLKQSGFSYSISADGELNSPALITPESTIRRAISEACTEALNQRGRSSTNLWETLGELDKSFTVLYDISKDIYKILRSKTLSPQERFKHGANAYLASRYGVLPLMKDFEAVVAGLKQKVGTMRTTSRGNARLQSNTTQTLSGNWIGQIAYSAVYTTSETIEIRAMTLDEWEATMWSNIGFTAKGALTVPWEFLKRSFIYDWFVNMGSLLGALTPAFGVTPLGSCYVTRVYQSVVFDIQTPVCTTYNLEGAPLTGTCYKEYESTTRVPGLVAPDLVIKSDFRFDKVTRTLDAVALIAQQLIKSH